MFRKKSFAAFLVVASLLLAACGGDDDNDASPIPGGGSGDAPEGEPIVIGLDEDSTSAGAAYSMVTAQAVRDTVDKVNSEGGVLGPAVGVMGSLQAVEVCKEILGLGESLSGTLLIYDAVGTRFRTIRITRLPDCPVCGAHAGAGNGHG